MLDTILIHFLTLCLCSQAISDQMKNVNLSKLASQISSFYGKAASLMQSQKLYNHPRGVELYATFEMKRRFFLAAGKEYL